MTKFLVASSLLVISTLTTACSDNKEHAKEPQEEIKAAEKLNPQTLSSEQQQELYKRKARAAQKGNILDGYNPDSPQVQKKQDTKKGSGNILDGYNPDSK